MVRKNKPFTIIYQNGHERYFTSGQLTSYFGIRGASIDYCIRLYPINKYGIFSSEKTKNHIATEILDDGDYITVWVEEV